LEEIIEEDARRGATTVVIVGDDKMVEAAIGAVADLNIVLGIIPMGGGEDRLAELLGIPEGAAACDVLSQRIIETLDVGKINGKMFFSRLSIFGQKTPLICDRKYEIFSPGGDIVIYNLNLDPKDKDAANINPKDGRLEVLVKSKSGFGFFKQNGVPSLFFAKELRMKSEAPFSVFVDGKKIFYKDVDVEVIPRGLKVVVGKNRMI
jgi:diacylglycerol kinase family enzyme